MCGQACGDRIHLDLGLAFAHARPQPCNHATGMRTAVVQEGQRTDCKLVVIGSGCEKFGEECGLRQKGIADEVTFLG